MRNFRQRIKRINRYYHGGEISVDRLSALSDGFIAIIITLMVLEIPVPNSSHNALQIVELFRSVIIYFASFVIVGIQWTRHHRALENVHKVTNSFVWKNLIFLFSLSLIPLLMKWMIKNSEETIPALSYAAVYFFTEFCMRWIFVSSRSKGAGLFHRFENDKAMRRHLFVRLGFNFLAIIAVLVFSVFSPQLEIFFLIFMPVILTLSNVFADEDDLAGV